MFPWPKRRRSKTRTHKHTRNEILATLEETTRSRRAIAEAYERERRRIERELHDGAQQYFVATSLALGRAAREKSTPEEQRDGLNQAQELLKQGLESLRRTINGIHPSNLRDIGLVAAVEATAKSYGPHIEVKTPQELPDLNINVLTAAYYFCAEVLANAAKHAPGAEVSALITADQDLRIVIVDDGPGGATLTPGRGLAEMKDRVAAFGGSLELSSPHGGPTRVVGTIPLMLNSNVEGSA